MGLGLVIGLGLGLGMSLDLGLGLGIGIGLERADSKKTTKPRLRGFLLLMSRPLNPYRIVLFSRMDRVYN